MLGVCVNDITFCILKNNFYRKCGTIKRYSRRICSNCCIHVNVQSFPAR